MHKWQWSLHTHIPPHKFMLLSCSYYWWKEIVKYKDGKATCGMVFMPGLLKGNCKVQRWEGPLWHDIHAKFNENLLSVLTLRKMLMYGTIYLFCHIKWGKKTEKVLFAFLSCAGSWYLLVTFFLWCVNFIGIVYLCSIR